MCVYIYIYIDNINILYIFCILIHRVTFTRRKTVLREAQQSRKREKDESRPRSYHIVRTTTFKH